MADIQTADPPVDHLIQVAAIGTCRIQVPLKMLADKARLVFTCDEAIGYMHNAQEMVQAVRLWKSEVKAPPKLAPLLVVNDPTLLETDAHYRARFVQASLVVIEVSSVRTILYQGWQLQINRLRELLNPLGVTERQIGRLFKRPSQRNEVLDMIRDGPLAEIARDIVATAQFDELEAAPAFDAVTELRQAIDGPILFVGIMAVKKDGSFIPQRVACNAALAEAALRFPDTFYLDPTPLVAEHGPETVLVDLGHYTTEFEHRVADLLMDTITNIVSARLKAPSIAP